MTENDLSREQLDQLEAMVREHGFESVQQALDEIIEAAIEHAR